MYAARLTYQPKGAMPMTQGNPKMLHEDKMLFGLSANFNNEAESESTNDFRAGAEFAMLKGRWYVGAEAYYMHIGFTKRQKIDEGYNYWGAYAQVGYFVHPQWQLGLRYDFYDRNGSSKDGILNMPAASVNFFIPKTNIKLSAMYQYIGRTGHATQLDRDLDDLGICTHTAQLMLQYAF
jgi:outer membrane receptor protein involved in Fe transport